MSQYTVELRNLINLYNYTREEIEGWFSDYDLADFLTTEQIAKITEANIWSKEKLAQKIVDWYYMREIGLETPNLFCHYCKIKMKRIMEKYLPIIYSKSLSYDILQNKNITESIAKMGSENGTNQVSTINQASTSASGLTINSDTPQRTSFKREYSCRKLRIFYNWK